MKPGHRPYGRLAWIALSAWLAACTGDETVIFRNGVLCVHPNRDPAPALGEELWANSLDEKPPGLERGDAGAADNDEGHATAPLTVQFNRSPGFHSADFPLELKVSDPDADVFYTLDGSTPNLDEVSEPGCAPPAGDFTGRTYVYSGPIDLSWWLARPNHLSLVNAAARDSRYPAVEPAESVAKAAVVRVQAARGDDTSPIVSGTFFVDPKARDRYSLPVVSLASDPTHLFDDDEGIYVVGKDPETPNYNERGREWEKPAHIELFDELGQRPVSQPIGVRVHGNFSRSFPQKSLRLYARKEYGPARLEHQFFDSKDTDRFKRLILRSGGNDWGQSLFRDAAIQSLVHHLPFETQHAQASVVFINGEYWGLHMLRDRLDEFHVEMRYGIPREQVAFLQANAELQSGTEKDVADYHALLNDLDAGNIDQADALDRHIALPELLDYTIFESYAGNTDWPHNNIGFFRYSGPNRSEERGPRDGRWRMMVFDVDRTLGRVKSLDVDMIDYLFSDRQGHWSRALFHGFIKIETVRHEFIQRMAVHLATTFAPSRVGETIETFRQTIEPELPEHIERWGQPTSVEAFNDEVALSHDFAQQRPRNVREHMVSYFKEVSGIATVRIHNVNPDYPPTLHGVRLSLDTPGVTFEDGVWEAPVFAGVPLILQSGGNDLSTASVEDGTVAEVTAEHLTLTLEADSLVSVYLP